MALPLPRSDDVIRDLACLLAADRVVSSAMVPLDLLTSVFMPVALRAATLFPDYTDEDFTRVTVFAVDGEDATCGRINGWPVFASCRVWLISDFLAAVELAKDIVAARDTILASV